MVHCTTSPLVFSRLLYFIIRENAKLTGSKILQALVRSTEGFGRAFGKKPRPRKHFAPFVAFRVFRGSDCAKQSRPPSGYRRSKRTRPIQARGQDWRQREPCLAALAHSSHSSSVPHSSCSAEEQVQDGAHREEALALVEAQHGFVLAQQMPDLVPSIRLLSARTRCL